MKSELQLIPLENLAIAFVPVLVVLAILYRWSHDVRTPLLSVGRMLVQLLLVGYILAYIFESEKAALVISVLSVMMAAASWIALWPVKDRRRQLYTKSLLSIAIGGVPTLLLVTQGVLTLDPWFSPPKMIPLAGMIFANAMNAVSLAADRFSSEVKNGVGYEEARQTAFRASLIPITNALFSVGIVSLPGMMTGQILSGVSPLIAVRYQIVVMTMVFGSAGISAACFLQMLKSDVNTIECTESALGEEPVV